MDAGLIDDDVWELRQALLCVRNPSPARDTAAIMRVGTPEHRLIHPVAFADQLVAEPEGFKHLYAAARDPVRSAELQRTVCALNDASRDVGKRAQLCCRDQACGPRSHDQHVDSGRNR